MKSVSHSPLGVKTFSRFSPLNDFGDFLLEQSPLPFNIPINTGEINLFDQFTLFHSNPLRQYAL